MKKSMILRVCLSAILMVFTLSLHAQSKFGKIQIAEEHFIKEHNEVSVSMTFVLDEISVRRNDMLILTPVLKSKGKDNDSLKLSPVVVSGSLRNKILNRKKSLGSQLPFDREPQTVITRKNGTVQSVNYAVIVPYKSWMDNASLSISEIVSGCASCYDTEEERLVAQNILPKQAPVSYKLTFIIPEVEPVKNRSDRHTATFNYIVDRYELLCNFKNNSEEFAQVDSVIGEIQQNQDLKITEFNIAGYASPEGGFEHNRILSQNRANSFADYLVSKFGVRRNQFIVNGFGEDWTGLYKAVSQSSLKDKQEVLDIINKVESPDARDRELLKLANGNTYKILLNDYYPPLRRTEYVIAYIVRPFDLEEAKKLIKVNPKLLSLNEMYLVAYSYPSDTKEFREVFDIAVRLYPQSDIAIVNSAGADIEGGNFDAAIERLLKIENNPKIWNNLGVAYLYKGDYGKAREYLSKAAANGNAEARFNLDNYTE